MLEKFLSNLYEGILVLPDKIEDVNDLIEKIEKYGISPQVYNLLKEKGKLEVTPQLFQTRLKHKYKESLFLNLYIKNQTIQLLKAFENKEIEVIPLKGVYFTEEFFGDLGARATSDIDILVKEEDLEKAIECVKEIGFLQEEIEIPYHFHKSFSKEIPGSAIPMTVEIHWDILKRNTAKLAINKFWISSVPLHNYKYVKKLDHFYNFYMICIHGWRHNLESPRYLLDIVQMIYKLKEEINYKKLLREAKINKTYNRILRTLSIVYLKFPYLSNLVDLPKKKTRRYHYSSRISSKHFICRYINFIDNEFLSFDSYIYTLREVIHWFSPTKTDISIQLGYDITNKPYYFCFTKIYTKRMKSLSNVFFRIFNIINEVYNVK
ncbi:MAG TPA: nucleotidyltransferase family protein [Niallia sp.]|nr:nucleotidyltransferase family protein [Niallia sp.]